MGSATEARVKAVAEAIAREGGSELVAAYFVGSRERGDALPDSDMDFVLVMRDGASEATVARLAALRSGLTAALGTEIAFVFRGLSSLLAWGPGVKHAGRHVFGRDIRGEIAEPTPEEYLARVTAAAERFTRALRPNREVTLSDLRYPKADDEYFGYVPDRAAARPLGPLFSLSFIATARIAQAGGPMVLSKLDIPRLYADHVGDEFAPWVADLFALARLRWRYRIPVEATERERLRDLCRRALAWERAFWPPA